MNIVVIAGVGAHKGKCFTVDADAALPKRCFAQESRFMAFAGRHLIARTWSNVSDRCGVAWVADTKCIAALPWQANLAIVQREGLRIEPEQHLVFGTADRAEALDLAAARHGIVAL